MTVRSSWIAAIAVVLLAGCVQNGSDGDTAEPVDDLRPEFPPATSTSAPGRVAPSTSATPATGVGTGPATTTAPGPPATEATTAPVTTPVTATITDPVGDTTPSVLERPPPWADLAGATLTRTAEGFELRVKLGGGRAPSTTDDEHTMNVASFYDIDGDGRIDYEVWANLSSGGWGGSWFDNGRGAARYNDDARVTWTPEGDSIVMRFPLAHLGDAARFRWSVASEWGRYDVLGTPASVRDDAPDRDQPASFNG